MSSEQDRERKERTRRARTTLKARPERRLMKRTREGEGKRKKRRKIAKMFKRDGKKAQRRPRLHRLFRHYCRRLMANSSTNLEPIFPQWKCRDINSSSASDNRKYETSRDLMFKYIARMIKSYSSIKKFNQIQVLTKIFIRILERPYNDKDRSHAKTTALEHPGNSHWGNIDSKLIKESAIRRWCGAAGLPWIRRS